MTDPPVQRRRHRWSWKRTIGLLACAAALVVVTLIALPDLLPDATVRRQVTAILAEHLGRPVTVESARLTWGDGLTATGVRIGRRQGEGHLATADRLTIQLDPLDAARAAAGGNVPLRAVRIEGLELWLTLDTDGRLNVDDLAHREPPLKIHSVQVSGASVHFENRRVGRHLTLRNVYASLGELTSTGHGYISVSADLGEPADAGEPASETGKPGHLVLTANLDRLDFGPKANVPGSLKAEWTDIGWPDVAAAAELGPRLAAVFSRTSGRMSASFGRDAWTAEGAVQAADLTLATGTGSDAVTIPQAILGFQLGRESPAAPLQVNLAKFSAPGVDLRASGEVRLERSAAQEDDRPGKAPWTLRHANLQAEGAIAWVALLQKVEPLGSLAKRFDRIGGKARIDLQVTTSPDGPHLTGSADLTDTLMVYPGVLNKEERQVLRLEVNAVCGRDLAEANLDRLELVTDAGRIRAGGHLPLASLLKAAPQGQDPGLGRRLAGARLTVRADIEDADALLGLLPALGARLQKRHPVGPLTLDVACAPAEADDGPPTWTAKVRGDLTATRLAGPARTQKSGNLPATFDALIDLVPDARRSNVRWLKIDLGKARVEWNGSARIDWPRKKDERPVGRFEGTLRFSAIEATGAIVAPDRFAPDPPLAGGATFNVEADLAEGRLRNRMEASLEGMTVRLGDYFDKPAELPASLAVTSLWHTGTWNQVEAEAHVTLPGARLDARGKGVLDLKWLDLTSQGTPDAEPDEKAPADAGQPPAKPKPTSAVSVMLLPTTSLDIRAQVSDLAKACDLSPLLKRHLEGYRAAGRAEGTFALAMEPQTLRVSGGLDLTHADLDVGPYLKKPAGRALAIGLEADFAPAPQEPVMVRVANVQAQLGDSSARADGWVRLDPAGLASPLRGAALVAAVLEEADLKVHADWTHTPALRQSLPWLEPLYGQCRLDGPTTWSLAVSGTPTRGRVRLDVNATDCRISAAGAAKADGTENDRPAVLKPPGTQAAIGLDVRYGEVPGEMVVDRLELDLADAAASAEGRLLFDDPRLVLLQRPTAWALRVRGRVPDSRLVASLLPAHLADLRPSGAVTFDVKAAADAKAAELESCHLTFDKARIEWLGKTVRLDGPLDYNHQRLKTGDGLTLAAGGSDVTLIAYVAYPNDDPTGSLLVRGKALDLHEVQEMIRRTAEHLAGREDATPAEGETGQPGRSLSDRLARRLQRLLTGARLSAEIQLDRVSLVIPEWKTRYDLTDLAAEGRLAGGCFVMPRFACALNEGTVSGEMALDVRHDVPVLSVVYDARNLQMAENLKPFIDSTFPGMQVFGSLSTRATITRPLKKGAYTVGRGETVLTDGLLEGPGAPDYITQLLPGLKLTRYHFNRMSNLFENKPDGDTDNRMLFDGKAYDLYIFGVTHPDGRTSYQLGVDLSVSLGSKTISRTLDQGKLPLMHYAGRIVGSEFAEQQISYVLPHEFAYDVFIRRNVLLQLIRRIGEKEPEIKRPLVAPTVETRAAEK
ncbi:MAG: hypothetical protein AMK72_05090 [Planctomycetes bacterium SM23_25]|nr:MAG: hypothetical protein AMK72_05090 [Planctomycetes bacterium SM23_25]